MSSHTGVIFLISTQRSGTNYLRSLLHNHKSIFADYKEVFDPNVIKQPEYFYNYLMDRLKEDPSAVLPSRRQEVFIEFVTHLRQLSQSKRVIIDIKYNSEHHLFGDWQPGEHPFVAVANQLNAPVIHLVRRNFFKVMVSVAATQQTGVYVTKKDNAVQSLDLDENAFKRQLINRGELINRYRTILRRCNIIYEMAYEDIDDVQQGKTLIEVNNLLEFLGEEKMSELQTELKKVVPRDLSTIIPNYKCLEPLEEEFFFREKFVQSKN